MTNKKEPMVRISGNRLITTSLAISNHFDKKHKHVLEAIQKLDCSEKFNGSNFRLVSYQGGNGQQRPMYEITRDGFMFLCMGFTGASAARWKERYIMAFNALEQSTHDKHLAIDSMQAELLTARPLWRDIKRYKTLGLNHEEVGKLVGRTGDTVRKHVRKMEQFGIIDAPKNLAQQQQMALHFLPSLPANTQGGCHA